MPEKYYVTYTKTDVNDAPYVICLRSNDKVLAAVYDYNIAKYFAKMLNENR